MAGKGRLVLISLFVRYPMPAVGPLKETPPNRLNCTERGVLKIGQCALHRVLPFFCDFFPPSLFYEFRRMHQVVTLTQANMHHPASIYLAKGGFLKRDS